MGHGLPFMLVSRLSPPISRTGGGATTACGRCPRRRCGAQATATHRRRLLLKLAATPPHLPPPAIACTARPRALRPRGSSTTNHFVV